MFLIDPVADAALEQQIVARAARFGNQGGVAVEYVLIKDSVEDEMMREITAKRAAAAGSKPISHFDFVVNRLKMI